jgi:hypothetical protein
MKCRSSEPSKRPARIGARANHRRRRRASSFARRSTRSATVSMARAPPSRQLPSGFPRRGGPESSCRRLSAARSPSGPARALNTPTKPGRESASPGGGRACRAPCHGRSSASRATPSRTKRSRVRLTPPLQGAARHSTAQHSTAQHSTAQHSTAQHSTAQHSTAQHSTALRLRPPGCTHQGSGSPFRGRQEGGADQGAAPRLRKQKADDARQTTDYTPAVLCLCPPSLIHADLRSRSLAPAILRAG